MKDILLHYNTREEISEKAAAGYAVVIPLAATEQHGPHLPVFTDSLICEHIVTEAVRKAAGTVPLLMAPVLTIGCSQHHLSYGGTLSFTSATYLQMLRDIGESLVKDGFKKIIFVNGHGGNDPIMVQTANDLAVNHPIWVASTAYWSVSRAALSDVNAAEVGMVPGHAGGFETAAIMALKPELVRTDLINTTHVMREWLNSGLPGTFIGKHQELTGYDGYTDAPNKATAELGKVYLAAIANSVADWLVSVVQAMEKGREV
ncbi:creatininase family protein [Paenibacillus eucommiae]|uniref:Creatinine amidohydrolase n=1 Tax=Paenibacillus eucommiae TaxID=1355755 RepID=A0ABS4J601_9BACL|nr:creatininase family protein [Paenibacillus eucommiae]MBP1994556.1 creatinine amidohydrolase [Paenibacillus eucommiae]